jgi:hypothetical protein
MREDVTEWGSEIKGVNAKTSCFTDVLFASL